MHLSPPTVLWEQTSLSLLSISQNNFHTAASVMLRTQFINLPPQQSPASKGGCHRGHVYLFVCLRVCVCMHDHCQSVLGV